MRGKLTARRTYRDVDQVVVHCDSMGECLDVVSRWMRLYESPLAPHALTTLRIVFERGREEDTLMAWRMGFDPDLGKNDWGLVS